VAPPAEHRKAAPTYQLAEPKTQSVAKTVWTGQNHFLVHSKQPVRIAEATDRMLRMTEATEVAFVVSNLAEAKLLTRDWMDKVIPPQRENPSQRASVPCKRQGGTRGSRRLFYASPNPWLCPFRTAPGLPEDSECCLLATRGCLFVLVVGGSRTRPDISYCPQVKALFDAHPKLGLVGGAALLVGGKPTKGTPGRFAFGEMAVGGPIAVRRKGYMQASVWLGSSETCGAGVGECKDPGQPLSSRMWAAGYQVCANRSSFVRDRSMQ